MLTFGPGCCCGSDTVSCYGGCQWPKKDLTITISGFTTLTLHWVSGAGWRSSCFHLPTSGAAAIVGMACSTLAWSLVGWQTAVGVPSTECDVGYPVASNASIQAMLANVCSPLFVRYYDTLGRIITITE